MRGELTSILYEASREAVEYVFGDSIRTLDQDGDGVEVTFEHSPRRRFGMVVGADGLHRRFGLPSGSCDHPLIASLSSSRRNAPTSSVSPDTRRPRPSRLTLLSLPGCGACSRPGTRFQLTSPVAGGTCWPGTTPLRRDPDVPPLLKPGVPGETDAGVGFLGLVAACWVMGSRFAAEGRRGWTWFSRLTGVLFLLAFVGVGSGSSSSAVVLGFWAALLIAWGWLAALSIELYRR